ncbi:MAG: DNA cytosine methyltransferase [Ketobacter sp.]|nr:DNA cytosine methyltransferase [Ketobacter sp.]
MANSFFGGMKRSISVESFSEPENIMERRPAHAVVVIEDDAGDTQSSAIHTDKEHSAIGDFSGGCNGWPDWVAKVTACEVAETFAVPVWAECVQKVVSGGKYNYSALCRTLPLRCFHDCAGMGGAAVSLAMLFQAGALAAKPITEAMCEIDTDALEWCLRTMSCPDRLFRDVTERGGGRTFDIKSGQEEDLPTCDLHTDGFPCQPFSVKNLTNQLLFDHTAARPYHAWIDEIKSGRHSAMVGENVEGMAKRKYNGEVCLSKVIQDIRAASCGRHFLFVARHQSPHLYSERAHRPRIFFLIIKCEMCLLKTEEEFGDAVQEFISKVEKMCKVEGERTTLAQHLKSLCDPPSATVRNGFKPGSCWQEPKVPNHPCPKRGCSCGRPISLSWKACLRHRLKSKGKGKWKDLHKKAWLSLPAAARSGPDYIPRVHKADRLLCTPRMRNMVELCARTVGECCWTDAIADLTQNHGRNSLRKDGLVPTMSTGSQMFFSRVVIS